MSKRLPCSGRTQAPECGLPSLGRSVPVPVAGTGDRIHRWETGGGEGLTPEKGGAGRRSRARKLSLQPSVNGKHPALHARTHRGSKNVSRLVCGGGASFVVLVRGRLFVMRAFVGDLCGGAVRCGPFWFFV